MSPIQESCLSLDPYHSFLLSISDSLSFLDYQDRTTCLPLSKRIDPEMYDLPTGVEHKSELSGWKSLLKALRRPCRSKPRPRRRLSKIPIIESNEQSLTPPSVHKKILELPASQNCRITPTVQQALVVARKGEYELCDSRRTPTIQRNDEILIRNCAVGLNPIDWKSVDYNFCLPEFPWVTGREMAGVVEKVGAAVRHLKPGDRVWTSTYYRDVRAGCFQKFVVVPQHTVVRIPGDLGFESAACLGVGALTATMTLRRWLDIPPTSPSNSQSSSAPIPAEQEKGGDQDQPEEEWLLIWGGATVTGQFATQVASQSGYKVITVTSSRTKPLSLRLGANYVVSRDGKANAEIVAEIKSIMSPSISTSSYGRRCITRAIDLVGPATAALALECLATHRPATFAPLAMMSPQTQIPENVTVSAVEMKQFVLDKSSREYAVEVNRLVENGMLKLPELLVLSGGLGDVVRGLEMVKQGDMGGRKVVVRV